MKLDNSKIRPLIFLLLGVVLSTFVFIKSSVSSFTHDESYSYLTYPHDSFIEIISFSNWFMNNHILNSLLMKYSERLFGNSEFALRLPNLLALLIYLFFGYKLFQPKNLVLSISVFTLISTNILLIDLFGMARGYGLSCGFMIMSLYFF